MRSITVTCGPFQSANAALISGSQTPSAGVPLTLTGSQPDARRVVITAGSEAAPRLVTLTGTGRTGQTQSETITIPASTAGTYGSALDFAGVSSLVSSTTFSAAVTVGTIATGSGSSPSVGSSALINLDSFGFGPVSFAVDVTNAGGSIAWTVDQSHDSPNDVFPLVAVPPSLMTWITPPDATYGGAAFTNGSTSKAGSMAARPGWLRLTITSVTGNAVATLTASQAGGKLG